MTTPQDFGALADGVHNDGPAIQAAVDYLASIGGGTLFFPSGTYRVNAKLRTSDPSDSHSYDGHPIIVSTNNIAFVGEDKLTTRIVNYALDGSRNDLATSMQVVAGKVYRGPSIFFKGGATLGAAIGNISIRNLTFDGTAVYTGDKSYPANVTTGDGWDLTQKPLWWENNRYFSRFEVINCDIGFYRGELLFTGGLYQSALMLVQDCDLHDTNGDGFSGSAWNVLRGNRIYKCAANGIECDTSSPAFQTVYEDNEIYLCRIGITLALYGPANVARQIMKKNRISLCDSGVLLLGTAMVDVQDNLFIDCGSGVGQRAIRVEPRGTTPCSDILIENNHIVCHSRDMTVGILASGSGTLSPKSVRIIGNRILRTQAAIAAGYAVGAGLSFPTDAVLPWLMEFNNESDSTNCSTMQSAASELLLTTTASTDVAKVRPSLPGAYLVGVQVEVMNAATSLTLIIRYWSSSGALQSITLENAASKAVGIYNYPAQFVYSYGATDTQTISVRVTASIANNVKISANISRQPISG